VRDDAELQTIVFKVRWLLYNLWPCAPLCSLATPLRLLCTLRPFCYPLLSVPFSLLSANQCWTLYTQVRGKLDHLARCTLGALIVIDVHARDVVEMLIQAKITSQLDFEWTSQVCYVVFHTISYSTPKRHISWV
jgi:hypothetical protein